METPHKIYPPQSRTVVVAGRDFYIPFPSLIFALLPGDSSLLRQKVGVILDDANLIFPLPMMNVYRWCACVTEYGPQPRNLAEFTHRFWTTPFQPSAGGNRTLLNWMMGVKSFVYAPPYEALKTWSGMDLEEFAKRLRDSTVGNVTSYHPNYFKPTTQKDFLETVVAF